MPEVFSENDTIFHVYVNEPHKANFLCLKRK